MRIRIKKPAHSGVVDAIPSKSMAHRWLIAAAMSGLDVTEFPAGLSEDIDATRDCLIEIVKALGEDELSNSNIDGNADKSPEKSQMGRNPLILDVKESGSSLRFLLPLTAALGLNADFICEGRLSKRPLEDLREQLQIHGCKISEEGSNSIELRGKLASGSFTFAGNVSSQYITGLLLTLPLLEQDSEIVVKGRLESRPYIDMTLDVLKKAGIEILEENKMEKDPSEAETETIFTIKGRQKYALHTLPKLEGDWSNAAFWLVLNEISGENEIRCGGLLADSVQGDKAIINIIEDSRSKEELAVDAADIPDLVPIVAVLACSRREGCITRIENARRLRFKESDRLKSVAAMIESLGGSVQEKEDGLVIISRGRLKGGLVDSHNDHRIVMAAAVAAGICDGEVEIENAEAVRKSYPNFFADYEALGGTVEAE